MINESSCVLMFACFFSLLCPIVWLIRASRAACHKAPRYRFGLPETLVLMAYGAYGREIFPAGYLNVDARESINLVNEADKSCMIVLYVLRRFNLSAPETVL